MLQAGARKNGKTLTLTTATATAAAAEDEKEVVQASLGLKDMFSKELRLITVVLFLAWPIGSLASNHFPAFPVTMAYYGITFGLANLSDDLFVNFIVGSLIGEDSLSWHFDVQRSPPT